MKIASGNVRRIENVAEAAREKAAAAAEIEHLSRCGGQLRQQLTRLAAERDLLDRPRNPARAGLEVLALAIVVEERDVGQGGRSHAHPAVAALDHLDRTDLAALVLEMAERREFACTVRRDRAG